MKARVFFAVFAGNLLAACATTPPPEPEIRTVEVKVPVVVSCIPAGAPITPNFQVTREQVLAAPDVAERLRLTAAGFLERDAYFNVAYPLLQGCAAAGAQR